ncbi:hypothetical protein [Marinicrinis sediminis]|uniref:Hydrolase n=1 Tax=Marinicrinis sediminis TaxID=1652465 RepID=A0ABW5RF69_9BACL
MKKMYYVSVQAHSVLEEKGAASFEFEIMATDREIEKLSALFEDVEQAENATFRQTPVPSVPYHELDDANDFYDSTLCEVYAKIHELGTTQTRQHIESMNILEKTE